MILKKQIFLIIFSFFYGIFFSLFCDFNNKIIKEKKCITKILFTLLFSLINAMIYFLGLQKINDGTLHIYSFITLTITYFGTHIIVNKHKKWYT